MRTKKTKRATEGALQTASALQNSSGAVRYFFSGCRCPINTSNVIVALAAGTPLQVAHLPAELLAPITLLATIGLRTYSQLIVDDYAMLLQQMLDSYRETNLACKLPGGESLWHPELRLAIFLAEEGPNSDYDLAQVEDAGYIFQVYEQLVNTNVEDLFQDSRPAG